MRGLKNSVVLVTGGGSGIGAAIAERLTAEGCAVAVFDKDTTAVDGPAWEVDITDLSAVRDGVAAVERELGPIAGLVNNAGWDRAVPFLKSEPDHWKTVIDINLYEPIHVTHTVLERMSERGAGRVVFIASDAGRVGSSGESVYAACKGGVIALAKTLAREVARSAITVNSICPGPTDTPLLAELDPDGKLVDALTRAIPLRRLGEPDDYPGLVAFLLSDDAAYITGQTISVSGGLTMHG